jgi:hypothetical protein
MSDPKWVLHGPAKAGLGSDQENQLESNWKIRKSGPKDSLEWHLAAREDLGVVEYNALLSELEAGDQGKMAKH